MKKIIKIVSSFIKKIDKLLLLAILLCSALSMMLLYSIVKNKVSSFVYSSTYKTQIVAIFLGLIIALLLSLFDYEKIAKLWFLYMPASIIMVLLTFTPLGFRREGADDKAWLNFGIMTIQPSEILKLAFILSFAYHLYKVGEKINKPLNILLLCFHGAVPVGLIALQGDDGTAIVFAVIFLTMLFIAGISWKYVLGAIIASPLLVLIGWNFVLLPHQKNRIKIVFDPTLDPLGTGYQQHQGKIALGSGQLFGKGLFGGDYTYVSEVQNDFIFSYLGQTLGFVGCIAFCCIVVFICIKILSDGNAAREPLGKYICTGVFAMLFVHYVLNIGMVLGVMPVIGVPLPFVSAGGTAVLSMYTAIGLVLSVYRYSEKTASIFSSKRI